MKIRLLDENQNQISIREIAEDTGIDFNHLPVTAGELQQAGKKIILEFSVPVRDIQAVFAQGKSGFRPSLKLEWTYDLTSSQQRSVPYISFYKLNQSNTVTVALSCINDDVHMKIQMDQMRCCYKFTVTVAIVPETQPFDLLVSFSPKRWNLLTESWRKAILPQGKPVFSRDAFQPVYCSWYAVHAAITNEYLDRAAELAAELGFKTFILDDGWSYDEMKRVCPEKMAEGWYRDIGNWTVSEKKLPDFKKHVEYAQKLGLKYLLWTSPFFAGRCSEEFKKAVADGDIAEHSWEDVAFLAPESKAAAHAVDLLTNLMRDYELDGLKIDFLDYIPNSTETPRSRKCLDYFKNLSRSLRNIKPDALLEFRQNYATPQMLEFGTQFRAGDVPFDFMENLIRLAHIRITLGDQVPCHADPIYFHPDELPENVARHMIAALAGVPMISMELADLTPVQKQIIKFWIDFYQAHFETFANGHWDVVHRMDMISHFTVENDQEAIVIAVDHTAVPDLVRQFAEKKHLSILNLTCSPIRMENAKAADCSGNPVNGDTAPEGGLLQR